MRPRRPSREADTSSSPEDSHAVSEGPTASSGFASEQIAFAQAVSAVAQETGLAEAQVIHDYWLVRTLHALSRHLSSDGRLPGGTGRWAFGGGTSLTAAWGFVRRYSEDLDGALFVADASTGRRPEQRRACYRVAEWATDDDDLTAPAIEGNRVLTSYLMAGDVPRFVKFETTIIEASADGLVIPHEVNSLLARHGEPEWVDAHQEIGGFTVPCVRPEWIAVNKFDALHRRAEAGDLRGLRERGRDLYDLWALARHSDVAARTRRRAPELWEPAAAGAGRSPTPRPQGGYAHSPAFTPGTTACETLREGYQITIDNTVWGDRPRFETALEAARSLDSQ